MYTTVTIPIEQGRFHIALPPFCCYCGKPADVWLRVVVSRTFGRMVGQRTTLTTALRVPYCTKHRDQSVRNSRIYDAIWAAPPILVGLLTAWWAWSEGAPLYIYLCLYPLFVGSTVGVLLSYLLGWLAHALLNLVSKSFKDTPMPTFGGRACLGFKAAINTTGTLVILYFVNRTYGNRVSEV